jgi:ABC-2 type transport system ATP-binding protein
MSITSHRWKVKPDRILGLCRTRFVATLIGTWSSGPVISINMAIIEFSEVTKVYDGRSRGSILALDRVNLSVSPGEIFGLLGPNGAGKTTLFRVLLGMISSTEGEVRLNGLVPSDPHSRDKVGYLPENHRFPAHLNGLGLLRLTGRLCGMPETEIQPRAELLLRLVGMEKWALTKMRKYSKGMTQRIGLAQALMNDPDILLLDEPTDGIDPVGKLEIRTLLQQLRDQGKTIVINSHLLSEVELAADRVAILNYGRVVRVGTTAELTVKRHQFEIEAAIGDTVIELPAEIGHVVFVSAQKMTVELLDDEQINAVIDMLRSQKISIRSVKPLSVSLEQSFMESIHQPRGN